jgi:hypothetical protein
VWNATKAGLTRERDDFERPRHAAEVADVGLNNVDGLQLDHAAPGRQQAVLLPAGDVEVECAGDLRRPFELPVRARLLEVHDTVRLEQPADLDRLPRRVGAVRVDEQSDVVTERAANSGQQRLRPAGPLVRVVSALATDAHT